MIGLFIEAWVAQQRDLRALVEERVYPQVADPKATWPYLVYDVITTSNVRSLKGPTGIRSDIVQIDVVHEDYKTAVHIAALIHGSHDEKDRRLDGYQGTLAGIDMREVRWLDKRESIDDPVDGRAQGPRRIQLDFKFTYVYLGGP